MVPHKYSKNLSKFNKLQSLIPEIDISENKDVYLKAIEAFRSGDINRYEKCLRRDYFESVFEKIANIIFERPSDSIEYLDYSGAITFFSRHPDFQNFGPIRFFLNWNKVCPELNYPFRNLNSALQTYFCDEGNCPIFCKRDKHQPDSNCLLVSLSKYLNNLRFSATNFVDLELPNKQGYVINLEYLSRTKAAVLLNEILETSDILSLKNISFSLLVNHRFISIKNFNTQMNKILNENDVSISPSTKMFITNIFEQVVNLQVFITPENCKYLSLIKFSFNDLLKFLVPLLIVPSADKFILFAMWLRLAQFCKLPKDDAPRP